MANTPVELSPPDTLNLSSVDTRRQFPNNNGISQQYMGMPGKDGPASNKTDFVLGRRFYIQYKKPASQSELDNLFQNRNVGPQTSDTIVKTARREAGKPIPQNSVDLYIQRRRMLATGKGSIANDCKIQTSNGIISNSCKYNFNKIGNDIVGTTSDDEAGSSVSLSADGNILAVGIAYNNGQAGLVRVSRLGQQGTWTQRGSDITGDTAGDQFGYTVSLSSDGNRVAISAPFNNNQQGQVKVYILSNNTWTQIGNDISGNTQGDQFGYFLSLSADGNTLATGAPYNDSERGLVRVFRLIGSTWTKIGSDITGDAAGDEFGASVSLSSNGNILAVGAPDYDSERGLVRVFRLIGSIWSQIGSDIYGIALGDEFGYSVSLSSSGNILAVGATDYDSDRGYVGVYRLTQQGTWVQIGSNIYGIASGDKFGYSVSLSSDGNRVAVGAPYNNNRGQVRVYGRNEQGVWVQIDGNINTETLEDNLGYSVSLSSDGNRVAVGAPYNDSNQNDNSGSVRVYSINVTGNEPTQLKGGMNKNYTNQRLSHVKAGGSIAPPRTSSRAPGPSQLSIFARRTRR